MTVLPNLADARSNLPAMVVEHETHFAVTDPRGILKANIHWGADGCGLTRAKALDIALRVAGIPMLLTIGPQLEATPLDAAFRKRLSLETEVAART